MVHLRVCISFKTRAGFAHQFRRHREVALRGAQVGVPEISRQSRQEPLHIRASSIPGHNSVNTARVSDIVQTWRVTGSSLTLECCGQSDSLEESYRGLVSEVMPGARGEERRGIAVRQRQPATSSCVRVKDLGQFGADGHDPALVEFCVAYGQDLLLQIYVG
jgi:hypothetical protein